MEPYFILSITLVEVIKWRTFGQFNHSNTPRSAQNHQPVPGQTSDHRFSALSTESTHITHLNVPYWSPTGVWILLRLFLLVSPLQCLVETISLNLHSRVKIEDVSHGCSTKLSSVRSLLSGWGCCTSLECTWVLSLCFFLLFPFFQGSLVNTSQARLVVSGSWV